MRYNNQIDKAIDKFFNEDFEITGRLGKIKFNRDQKKELWSCVKNDLESENKELGDIICGWLYKTISQGMKFNQELSIEIGELFKKRINDL